MHVCLLVNSLILRCQLYQEHDPFLVLPLPSNPWITDDVAMWELDAGRSVTAFLGKRSIRFSLSILFYSISFYSILVYSIPFCFILFYSIPFNSIPFYSILLYTICTLIIRCNSYKRLIRVYFPSAIAPKKERT